jgi:hypothetical protein
MVEGTGTPGRPDGAASGTAPGESASTEAERLAELSAKYAEDAAKWARGADGERRTAEQLDSLGPGFVVLHDLHVPGSDANVDHLVLGTSGVFVVDSKAYSGPFSERSGTLWSGSHPVRREVDTVEFIGSRVSAFLGVPVRTVLCFTDAPLPRRVVELGATVAVGLDGVRSAVATGAQTLSAEDVERLGRRAGQLREPVQRPALTAPDLASPRAPAVRPAAPRAAPSASKRSVTAASRPAGPRRGGRKPTPSVASLVVRLVVLVVGIVVVLPAVLRGCSGARPGVPGAPTTTAEATGPAVTLQFACPGPGQGYTASYLWPAGTDPTTVQVKVSAGGLRLVRAYWTDLAKPPKPLTGVTAGTTLEVQTSAVGRPFQKPSVQVATAPATPC